MPKDKLDEFTMVRARDTCARCMLTAGGHQVVVGSGGVGKSCMTIRFLKDEFLSEYDPTIGAPRAECRPRAQLTEGATVEENFRKKVVLDNNYECTLNIVDTAGQQEYSSLRDQHLRTGQGFLLCFALNDENSFNEIKELQTAILRAKESKVPLVVAGNKVVRGHAFTMALRQLITAPLG